jgi:hypothetical protein
MKMFSKLCNASSDTSHGDDLILSRVSCLLFRSLPFTVLLAVTTIVVFSSKSQSGWPLAHIRYEIGNIHPAFANPYSTTSIVFPRRIVRVSTSVYHCLPNRIDLGSGKTVLRSMTFIGCKSSERSQYSLRHSIAFSMLCLAADVRLEPASAVTLNQNTSESI